MSGPAAVFVRPGCIGRFGWRFPGGGRGGQSCEADVLDCCTGAPRGDSQGLRLVNVEADAELFSGGFEVDVLFVVDPALNPAGGDADADVIPSVVVEVCLSGGFVVGGVVVVYAGDSADGSAPAADYEGYAGVADGEGQSAEEVVSAGAHSVEIDFVIEARQGAGPGDAGEGFAGGEEDGLVCDVNGAVAVEVGDFPVPESSAVEQGHFGLCGRVGGEATGSRQQQCGRNGQGHAARVGRGGTAGFVGGGCSEGSSSFHLRVISFLLGSGRAEGIRLRGNRGGRADDAGWG